MQTSGRVLGNVLGICGTTAVSSQQKSCPQLADIRCRSVRLPQSALAAPRQSTCLVLNKFSMPVYRTCEVAIAHLPSQLIQSSDHIHAPFRRHQEQHKSTPSGSRDLTCQCPSINAALYTPSICGLTPFLPSVSCSPNPGALSPRYQQSHHVADTLHHHGLALGAMHGFQ